MPTATFNPSIEPSPGISRKTEFKILKAEFGDGYSQPTRDGKNHARRRVSLSWDVLTDDQADEINGFLFEKGGDTPFFYTLPRETVAIKWTCENFEDSVNSDGTRKITAEFVQSFTL